MKNTAEDLLYGRGGMVWCAVVVVVSFGCSLSPEERFEKEALPVLQQRCFTADCHGVMPGTAWPEHGSLFVALNSQGEVADVAAARQAALANIVTVSPPELSSLVRIPLPVSEGGGPHFGGVGFRRNGDSGLAAVLSWIRSESRGGEDIELTVLEQQFADTVMPGLVERCSQANCHGPNDGMFAVLTPRLHPETEVAAPADIRAAYKSARKHLDLWSADPMLSRLVRKGIWPAFLGGMAHRRAPTGFFPIGFSTPATAEPIRAIVDWNQAERAAIGAAAQPVVTALLFVGGPAADRAPFRIELGATGSDLFTMPWPVEVAAQQNLTAAWHPSGPAEIRDPALSHDAGEVVFAMRRVGDEGLRLWRMDLATREAQPLVNASVPGSFVQPVFAPDGRVVAVWDGHGELGSDGNGVAPELVAIDQDGALERLTFTPCPEVTPAFLATGKTRGQLLFSTRRHGETGLEGVLFRFPLCHNGAYHNDPEYHVHFGSTIAPITPLGARDLADGRQIFIGLSGPERTDDRGMLGLLDRSLGPMVKLGQEANAAVLDYKPAVTWLDATPRYRDPTPLPDGRVIVVADSPDRLGHDALYTVRIADGDPVPPIARTPMPRYKIQELLAMDGLSLRSPVPVVPRPAEDDPHPPAVNPAVDHGFLVFRNAGVLETLYGRAQPAGLRTAHTGVRSVRLLKWTGAKADKLHYDEKGGTTIGLTHMPPVKVLGEWPLFEDQSIYLRVPAHTPILPQWLDARGMKTGNQLNRWYYTEGGETIGGGTNVATYPHACSGCHGAMSGVATDELAEPPDAISSASITLATHADRNPRQPLAPISVSDSGQTVDFRSDVGPLFEETCAKAGCHSGPTPVADLPLDGRLGTGRFPLAYEQLLLRMIDRQGLRARSSVLIERLLGEELDAPELMTGVCPPGGADEATVQLVIQWIETGAPWDVMAREKTIDAP